ncbi:MAG: hypothetical protein LBB50_00410 [Oscillospiraceae bacterium]|nr:hypothetical protein [Oscillospiraceae bacterium]
MIFNAIEKNFRGLSTAVRDREPPTRRDFSIKIRQAHVVMAVPLLTYRLGENMPSTIGMGLGAGLAFLIVSLLVNSGLHILHKNKAIPSMFSGVPAALIYMGLLALAFMGFTGEILFQ